MNTENKSTELNDTDKKLHISDISDSVIKKFLSTKKYKYSFVNIVLKKEKYKTVETLIGSDELLKDFVDYIKHYR